MHLVLWFLPFFWVVFDVKTAKIETELSPTFTKCKISLVPINAIVMREVLCSRAIYAIISVMVGS